MFDCRLITPSRSLLAGPSGCGKTTLIAKILLNGRELFTDSRCMQNIHFYYKEWQPIYQQLQSELGVKFYNSVPTYEEVKTSTQDYSTNGGSLVVIDDFMQDLTSDVKQMWTSLSHHSNLTMFLLVQNLFPKNPHYRDISINSNYIFIFKNPRDSSQIVSFARQF